MGYSVLKISKGRKVGAGFSMSACGDARGMGGLRPSDAWGALSAPGLPQQNTKKILNGARYERNLTFLLTHQVRSGAEIFEKNSTIQISTENKMKT
jgi:hypothetical protein